MNPDDTDTTNHAADMRALDPKTHALVVELCGSDISEQRKCIEHLRTHQAELRGKAQSLSNADPISGAHFTIANARTLLSGKRWGTK